MLSSRIAAAIIVFLLILFVALVSIGIVLGLGSVLTHGYTVTSANGIQQTVEHSAGVVKSLGKDHTLVLVEAGGKLQSFTCIKKCLTELSHIQRHVNEVAHTDIYFIREPNNILEAVDVD